MDPTHPTLLSHFVCSVCSTLYNVNQAAGQNLNFSNAGLQKRGVFQSLPPTIAKSTQYSPTMQHEPMSSQVARAGEVSETQPIEEFSHRRPVPTCLTPLLP